MRNQLFKQNCIKCEVSLRELWEGQFTFFTVDYTMSCFFTFKNCKFNGKIISQLFTVYSTETLLTN